LKICVSGYDDAHLDSLITDLPFREKFHIEASLLNWLEVNSQYALALVFVFAFAEACIGIGLFVSVIFLVSISSWLYTTGAHDLSQIIPLAFVGALISDHVGFHVGYRFGPRLHELEFVRSRRNSLQRAENVIRKYGAIAVFIGRLVPAIRSLIPALLGATGFRSVYFTILDIAACLLWSLGLGIIIQGVDKFL